MQTRFQAQFQTLSFICFLAIPAWFGKPAQPATPNLQIASSRVPATRAPVFGYRVLARYPHDPKAFTQGLVYADGRLYEGTGIRGESSLRRVDPRTGRIERMIHLDPRLFGEGITDWQGRLVQLTWRAGVGLIYDREGLEIRDRFRYQGEGWGITQDGRHWIMSDGSDVLRFLDPDSRRELRRLSVRDGDRPVRFLNELEQIDGEIWANVWRRDYLVRIDPDSGAVTGYVDLAGLCPEAARGGREAVLNGIAYDARNGRLFVTGKYWPWLYRIETTPP